MSSEETQRGVFPGAEFFTTLKKIAKKAMQEIHQINRDLTTPSAVHEIKDGDLWTELHLGYNTAYNQSIGLQQSFSTEQSVYDSLESFDSMIKWIKIETNRIEKQLQQFGYTPDNNNNYEYNLPLTPQEQDAQNKQNQNLKAQQMDVITQENEDRKTNNHNSMDIDNENDTEDGDEDSDININSKQNQQSDLNEKHNKMQLNPCSKSPKTKASEPNPIKLSLESSTNPTATPMHITHKVQSLHTLIPSTPKTPALDDKFKMFYKNLRGKSGASNERNKANEHSMNIDTNRHNLVDSQSLSTDSHPSSISAITPSVSTSVLPSKYGQILQTPLLSNKFDRTGRRKGSNQHNESHHSNLDDSLGSIPCLQSPRYTFKGQGNVYDKESNDVLKSRNGTNPITPYQINHGKADGKKIGYKVDTQTPITVSSFSLQRKQELSTANDMFVDEIETSNDTQQTQAFGMSYITETEFAGIPQWITNQVGCISEINATIDVVNEKLKSLDGRITKPQFKDLIGGNETPFILLLTRTNRLKTDWCQGNSVYCLP